jgi:hypothetical protein
VSQVSLARIWKMLDECAPGHLRQLGEHRWIVKFRNKTFTSLPKGAHGSRPGQGQVPGGRVRAMVRHLGIDVACASRHFPQLMA